MQLISVFKSLIELKRIFRFVRRTALCRHHNHSIGSTWTINSSRSRIFQNFNRLHIRSIDRRQTTGYGKSIYDNQRFTICGNGTRTAYPDRRSHTHFRCLIRNRQSSHSTLQGSSDITHRSINQLLTFQLWNRTCQMRFRLCTVTDYHNIIQHLRIFFQRHIHNCTFANRFRLINVTDIRINQNCLGIRNLNGVFTFSVRHSTGRNGSVFHCHRSSN